MYKSMYGKGVNACISLILESALLIFSEAKGLRILLVLKSKMLSLRWRETQHVGHKQHQ